MLQVCTTTQFWFGSPRPPPRHGQDKREREPSPPLPWRKGSDGVGLEDGRPPFPPPLLLVNGGNGSAGRVRGTITRPPRTLLLFSTALSRTPLQGHQPRWRVSTVVFWCPPRRGPGIVSPARERPRVRGKGPGAARDLFRGGRTPGPARPKEPATRAPEPPPPREEEGLGPGPQTERLVTRLGFP